MTDSVTFREAPTPPVQDSKPNIPDPEPNNERVVSGADKNEPIEFREEGGRSIVLDALNITDDVNNLTADDRADLGEVKQYVMDILRAKGLSETVASFKKSLDSVREEMGLDKEADPSVVIERIAGVVKAWKNISFIKDSGEKKRLFMKLANMKSTQEMNKEVFKTMEEYKIWQ